MYSTKTAITYGIQDLLETLSDYDIYSYYIGKFRVGKLYNSPLRNDDKNPSFAVFPTRNGQLLFKDHGSGVSGNAITFVKLISNSTTHRQLEKELLKIAKKTDISKSAERTIHYVYKTGTRIGIVRQPFTETDIKYWKQFEIDVDTLNMYNVFSIKYFLCNDVVKGIYSNENPMYAYKVDDKFKIYRPLASKYKKWRSNLNNENIQGMKQLSNNNILVITKSLKDVMVLHKMNIDAISPSSETTFIPESILNDLKQRYKHILILFDRDKTGMLRAREFSNKYNLDAFFINKKYKAKDISDAVKINGFEEIKNWITKVLNKYD